MTYHRGGQLKEVTIIDTSRGNWQTGPCDAYDPQAPAYARDAEYMLLLETRVTVWDLP